MSLFAGRFVGREDHFDPIRFPCHSRVSPQNITQSSQRFHCPPTNLLKIELFTHLLTYASKTPMNLSMFTSDSEKATFVVFKVWRHCVTDARDFKTNRLLEY